ncbi:hypothetical protein [Sphingomonas lenta]|uniref:Uncharacterized protein n=1 Tax=Sphingomonas lenta TaxID=1141887 RepID=A0A2A2SAY3_9SPHN|nr:hypothetical protein [Sphingomonas lenta]PAX06340.1 hypothetical protein CKY28_17835 [Sphingomonas lenta]
MFGFDDWAGAPPAASPLHPATAARRGHADALVRALVAAGVWDKLESLHVPAAHSRQAALIDWTGRRGPATVGGGAPVFVPDRGVYCDGADDWVDLGFAPADGVRFQQSSATVAMWARNASPAQGVSGFGLAGSTAVGLNPRGASGLWRRGSTAARRRRAAPSARAIPF